MSRPRYAGKVKPTALKVIDDQAALVAAIDQLPGEALAHKAMTVEHVLQTWSMLASADLTGVERIVLDCCRNCHGFDHAYQWVNEQEWARAVAEAVGKEGKEPPDMRGGFGYRPQREPHPECPECFGRGTERREITDTRSWTPQQRLLFNGFKMGRTGWEPTWRDRDTQLAAIAKHLGMFKERVEHTGADGNAIQFVISPGAAGIL